MELDIYIPSIKIGIEYDGVAWHNSENSFKREKRKYDICKKAGIRLIRIKEKLTHDETNTCDKIYYTKKSIDDTIKQLIEEQLVFDDINVERDQNKIFEQYKVILKEHSLKEDYPEISKEWHPTKNGDLKPAMFASKSGQKVWWKCKNGHEWFASIALRTYGNHACPFCVNQKVQVGFNDLATLYPEIASQWHPTNNIPLSPKDVTIGSGKIVWWRCDKGHEWKTMVKNRTKGIGCPICAGKIPVPGKTDLATVFPEVAKEWNFSRNGNMSPQTMSPHSGKKVWWRCEKGHEWQATVDNRVKGRGCPYCGNKAVLQGYNDLQTVFPSIAAEWHPSKNGSISPQNVVCESTKKVWWKCRKCGHEWQTSINVRTRGHGCPICGMHKSIETKKRNNARH